MEKKYYCLILLPLFISSSVYADILVLDASNNAGILRINNEIESSINIIKKTSKDNIKYESIVQIEKIKIEYEKLNKEILKKAKEIDNDREKLEVEKNDLKKSKELYSTGLYASFGAMFLALIGFVSRRPLIKLEMKLKSLEIKEKEMLLESQFKGKSVKSNNKS